METHKTPGELCAKSRSKKKLHSSKSVLGRKRKAKSQVWRIATWNLHSGLMAPVKSIMGSATGLGFAVANSRWSKVSSSRVYSDRIAVLILRASEKLGFKFFSIINLHAPTLASTRENPVKSEEFYLLLQEVLSLHLGKHEEVILMGDWNVKLGKRRTAA